MAVDAQHFANNFFQDLFTSNMEGNINTTTMYNNNIAASYGGGIPFSGVSALDAPLLPVYANQLMQTKHQNQGSMKDDSGLTCAIPSLMQRKRGRNHSGSEINQQSFQPASTYQKVDSFSHSRNHNLNHRQNSNNMNTSVAGGFSFLGEDVSVQMLQQQIDIDRFIYQHMEKVRMEINERRKQNSRRMIEVVEEGILKRLKSKEDEIEKVGRLNWALEERVRSLSVENQIWRELAQTNEATANALRSNLEQVLAQVNDIRVAEVNNADVNVINNIEEDAESCCGSSSPQVECMNNIVGLRGVEDKQGWRTVPNEKAMVSSGRAVRMCRNCGKGEACVVLLTCRHMCLCAGCGSTRGSVTCPVCKSVNDATLLLNH